MESILIISNAERAKLQRFLIGRVKEWKGNVAHFWKLACRHDGVNPKSSFVVFSEGNPFESQYETAMQNYLRACRQLQSGDINTP